MLDIAVTHRGGSSASPDTIAVLLGNGSGDFAFAGPLYAVGDKPLDLVAVDLNADTELDLAVANNGSDTVTILLGLGDGGFVEAANSPIDLQAALGATGPLGPSSIRAGDLDIDGRLDLVVGLCTDEVACLFNDGGNPPLFQTIGVDACGIDPCPGPVCPADVALADFDGDLLLDIATANNLTNDVSVIENSSDQTSRTFRPPHRVSCGTGHCLRVRGIDAADFGPPKSPFDPEAVTLPDIATCSQDEDSVLVLMNQGGPAGSFVTFETALQFPSGESPTRVRAFDAVASPNLAGSPALDLVVSNSGGNSIAILPGRGAVGPRFDTALLLTVGGEPRGIAAGLDDEGSASDAYIISANSADDSVSAFRRVGGIGAFFFRRGDFRGLALSRGITDLVGMQLDADSQSEIAVSARVSDFAQSGRVQFLEVTADGAYVDSGIAPLAVTGIPQRLISGGFLGSFQPLPGPDIAVTSTDVLSGVNRVTVRLWTGQVFAYDSGGRAPRGIDRAEFTGDGLGDIVVANALGNSMRLLLATGQSSSPFTEGSIVSVSGGEPWAVAAGDLDGDSMADAALAHRRSGRVEVLLGDGNGGFSAEPVIDLGAQAPVDIIAVDVENDGDLDLVTANFLSNSASLLTNDGTGSFALTTLPAGNGPTMVRAGFFKGDSNLDLVVSNALGSDPSGPAEFALTCELTDSGLPFFSPPFPGLPANEVEVAFTRLAPDNPSSPGTSALHDHMFTVRLNLDTLSRTTVQWTTSAADRGLPRYSILGDYLGYTYDDGVQPVQIAILRIR